MCRMHDFASCNVCKSSMEDLHTHVFDNRHGYPGIFKIVRCPTCGFCRTEPSLKREDLSRLYRDYYPRHSVSVEQVKLGFEGSRVKSRLTLWLEGEGTACYHYISPGGRVLDVGCGSGTALLMAKHLGAKEVVGIEVDSNIRRIAEGLNLAIHFGHLTDMPDELGLFDYILASQVIEHDPEPESLLCEMKKRLSENGVIILSFPNVDCLYRRLFKDRWLHWHVPYHINHFSKKSVEILAGRCGLTIKKIKTVTPNSWTEWQMRANKIHVEAGRRDTFWDPGLPDNIPVPAPKVYSLFPGTLGRKLLTLKKMAAAPVICLFNRCLDLLGLGESFVVVLSK